MSRTRLFLLGAATVASCLLTTTPRAEDIVIYTGHAGHDPGYTQLAALYESMHPDLHVVVTDDFGDVARERLTFISLLGWSDPNVVFQFEELIQIAIHWTEDRRLVVIGDSSPPYDPSGINGVLSIMQTGLALGAGAHGAVCGNLTAQIAGGHDVTAGVTELAYGQSNEITVDVPGTALAHTGDGQQVIIAAAPVSSLPGGEPCSDLVLLADASILSDECNALAHPGNRQLARNLYENCAGGVPVEAGTWGVIKALYR